MRNEAIEHTFDEQRVRPLEDLTRRAQDADVVSKRLTGRTPERIAEETGIPRERIFPSKGTMLYVGDPWQRMGREIDDSRLTVMDYEFGETASFVIDNESFRTDVRWIGEGLLERIRGWQKTDGTNAQTPKEREWLERFKSLVREAHERSDAARFPKDLPQSAQSENTDILEQNVWGRQSEATEDADDWKEDYGKAKDAWAAARTFLEETYRQERKEGGQTGGDPGDDGNDNGFSWFRRDAWYRCIEAERGFGDIPDWHITILPKVEAKRQELAAAGHQDAGINEEINRFTKIWIDELRLKKKPERANVLEAMFPELPFRDASFDRFIASWSVSAHAFDDMDTHDFADCWHEISRVLKPGGEAFIFPIRVDTMDRHAFIDSLEHAQDILDWKLYDGTGNATDNLEDARTLWLQKL